MVVKNWCILPDLTQHLDLPLGFISKLNALRCTQTSYPTLVPSLHNRLMQGRFPLPICPATAGPHLVWAAQQSRRLLNAQHIFPVDLALRFRVCWEEGQTDIYTSSVQQSGIFGMALLGSVLYVCILSNLGPEALKSLEGHQTVTSVLGSLSLNIMVLHFNCKGFRKL